MSKADILVKDGYDQAALKAEIAELGFELQYLPETESTMNLIAEQAQNGEKSKIVALTDHQTGGVGRSTRVWDDIAGRSLMLSILFHIPQESVAAFSDLVALSVCEAVSKAAGCGVMIKYPNDLVIDDKKTGGILVKNIYNDKLNYLGTNVGIGINVHYSQDELAKFQVDYPATSLDIYSEKGISRQELLLEIVRALRYLETEIGVIMANPRALEPFDRKWLDASSVYKRRITILKNDRIVDQGLVVDAGIGRGVEIESDGGKKWFSLYETDMKARVIGE